MHTARRVTRNSLLIMASQAALAALSLVSIGLVARYLSPAWFGKYLFVVAFANLFEVFTDMGFNIILVREIARGQDRVRELVGGALLPKGIAAVATVILTAAGINVFVGVAGGSPALKPAVYLLVVALSADAFTDIFISTVRAHQRMEFEALVKVFNRLLALGLLAGVVWLDLGFLGLFEASLLANVATSLLAFLLCLRIFGLPRPRAGLPLGGHLTRESLPLGVGQIVNRGYIQTNMIALKALRVPAEVGFYGGAARLVEQLNFLPVALVSAVFPVLSELSQASRQRLTRASEKTLKLLSLVAFPVAGGLIALAAPLVVLVFGPRLAAISLPLQVLAVGIAFNFGSLLFKFVLSAVDQQAIYQRNMLLCFLVNLALAGLLIPRWGCLGACAGSVAASLFLFWLSYRSVTPYLEPLSLADVMGRPLLASALMVLILKALHLEALPLAVPAGALAYGVSLLALGAISREEFQTAKEVILGQGTGGRA